MRFLIVVLLLGGDVPVAADVERVEEEEVLVLDGHPPGYDPQFPPQIVFGASQAHVSFVKALPSPVGL